jgi:hypothetical protein
MGNAPAIDWENVGESYTSPTSANPVSEIRVTEVEQEVHGDVGVVDALFNYAGDIGSSRLSVSFTPRYFRRHSSGLAR